MGDERYFGEPLNVSDGPSDVAAIYPEELVSAILEMPGLSEDELFAVLDDQPELYALMVERFTGEANDPRRALAKQVKTVLAREVGLCMLCDEPVTLIGDGPTCVRCTPIMVGIVQLPAAS